ncbi:Nif3-like dinuclear metal center hexameric protein [Mucilaginibacter glaciei]|uniref:Nif3-like dinuclear metal center hexameric protein n=1 Tax=Mucilaginibacter glaciei TaxID=2772109 RepID=A0A926NNI2_9SPHI|nr:Nif3-like dinuclear metal center hexameric protein [Mucilaginibacter glaciei]MBD1391777.1 Nif3-like dinuclear metal center hexameric protein [Mucilaginibacter glaciei]
MSSRRSFIVSTTKVAGALTVFNALPSVLKAAVSNEKKYTVQEIIDVILKEGKLKLIPGTVDTIKSGSADTVVTGIVTTMFATIEVIEQTAKLGANFIIAHEPTFYNHVDDKEFVKNNPVMQQKLDLLNKYKITIWRCHDYIHSINPDIVGHGFLKKTGWLPYYKGGTTTVIPSQSLLQVVQHLKSTLNIAHVRVIGDLKQPCQKLTIIPGAAGGKWHLSAVISDKPDALIIGEQSEWETAEFIRNANEQGRKVALIVLGHSVSEEPGMEYFVEWLAPKLPGVKITHLTSGDPFTWL